MKKILITGATGLIGKSLTPMLRRAGYDIHILTTQKNKCNSTAGIFYWNPIQNSMDENAVSGVDIIIHLAGANVGKGRWTKKYKQEILDSRIKSAQLLFSACKSQNVIPKKIISASGIGFYADPTSVILDENSPNGDHFLAKVCKEWEASMLPFTQLNSSVTIFRTGPVLSATDGLLKAFLMSKFLRVIPTTGSAANILSWIHISDLCKMYLFACETDLEGVYNAVAPGYCSQKELVHAIGDALQRKFIYPNVPGILLKLALGESAALALTNQQVMCDKIIKAGFKFQFADINNATKNLLNES